VLDVAAAYPQLCEAETRAFARLLGVHVQRLSTLTTGGHVCTTSVPTSARPQSTDSPVLPTEGQP
jgi:predicted ArsR family transcriptional regulator